MKTTRILMIVFVLALATIACRANLSSPETIVGSGNLTSEERQVKEFSAVEIAGSADVDITIGEVQSVTVEAEDNILPLVETTVRGDRLVIGTKINTSISPTRPIRVTITVTSLNAARITGSGNINIEGIDADSVELEVAGSGDITATGSAERVEVSLSGSGNILGGELEARTANVSINGSGDITVYASESLDATIRGSGNVGYRGNPAHVDESIPGSGAVKPVP